MAILVTGGAGYIGSHVAYELVDASRDVIVLDNLSTGFAGAVPSSAHLVIGDIADEALLRKVHAEHGIDAIIHMAGSVVVPESITDPLGYYLNNTARSRTLIAFAVAAGIRRFIFSSTAAVYGTPAAIPVGEDAPLRPVSPYGTSKMMTELMLGDTTKAQDLRYVALRYFNVAGADPAGRTGQSTRGATHLVKVACEAATGRRDGIDVFGMDYPTRDGNLHSRLHSCEGSGPGHVAALSHLESSGPSQTLNCGYSRGFSVLEVIKWWSEYRGARSRCATLPGAPETSPRSSPTVAGCAPCSTGLRATTTSMASCGMPGAGTRDRPPAGRGRRSARLLRQLNE